MAIFPVVIFVASALYYPYPGPEENPYSFANPPMCAPSVRFEFEDTGAPLAPALNYKWDHSFPVTTSSKEAQRFFDQGLFFTYAFNHAEAERSFREAVRLDPNCAMAHWGVALSLGPNINRPMLKEVMTEAFEVSQQAMKLRGNCTPKEQAVIEALALRYLANPPADRSALDQSYADAMRLVAHEYREDVDILTLFAEALMDTTPWDYWRRDGTPKYVTKEIHAVLKYIIKKAPDHPGANHYYIHAMEEFRPEEAEASADNLTRMAFVSGHLVHMPSHIYVRLGRYQDANKANVGGIALDEDYIEQCQAQGYYPAQYYPHNLHFLWFGASMTGQSELAMDAARRTATKGKGQRFEVIPLYSMLRFGKWADILKETRPANKHPFMDLLWHYARGMAFANTGDLTQAKRELKTVKKRLKSRKIQKLPPSYIPFKELSEICYLILDGELAGMNGDADQKVEQLQLAVKLQDGFRYTEPPYFYLQMRQALGAALLEAQRPAEAEKVYRKELARFPANGWSLYGLHQSLVAQKKTAEAQEVWQQFEMAWKEADVEITASVL